MTKIHEIKEDVLDNIYYPVIFFFLHKWRFLKRLFFWIPKIYEDEDWSNAFLYKMMEYKISRMRKDVTKNKRHIGWEKDVRSMKVAEELLRRLSWGSTQDYHFKSEFCTCPDNCLDDKYWLDLPNGDKQYNFPTCSYCMNGGGLSVYRKKQKADYDYLWYHMKKNSYRWWN